MGEFEPHFDFDFQRGLVGEKLHDEFLQSLAFGKHEVKTDYQVARTGNFYVETHQHRDNRAHPRPSGLNVTESKFWVQASPLGVGAIYVKTDALKEMILRGQFRQAEQPISGDKTMASVGRLVRLDDVLKLLGFKS